MPRCTLFFAQVIVDMRKTSEEPLSCALMTFSISDSVYLGILLYAIERYS